MKRYKVSLSDSNNNEIYSEEPFSDLPDAKTKASELISGLANSYQESNPLSIFPILYEDDGLQVKIPNLAIVKITETNA